jgi:hypothetical protein
MSGDYTRARYSAQSGYIGVLEQQGRVRLEADGNELVESIDRRRRAESIDTIGHGVVPLTTKDGFLIQQPTAGQWTIGAGRAYVDGILVDCWGDGASAAFQPDLGELRSPNPLAFQNQPFYYGPSFPSPPATASFIVYLDVWEREVTALEDPGLIDPALEGIDTTTRLQAAWQVKALSPTTAGTCNDNPPEWQNLIAPSTGTLTTATTPAPSSGSPCTIDPVKGYTGLENQFYRVQVWRSGTVDGATPAQFVWSPENASLGAVLLGITTPTGTTCQLSVSTVGRDRTFGFKVDDVLEVLDDFVEWSIRETNTGGQFVKVTGVDAEQLTITVKPDISGTFTVVPGQHPRIRRWAAVPQPTQNGVAIPLDDGVTVTFGPSATATLRAGDYWVFYARTATGTIEVLNQAPPRGTLHHYMRLALVTPTQVQDCRQFWPPTFEGCCTVVVNVGDDIQKAIDSLPPEGGCVCLKTGTHLITQPIRIAGRTSISLHGESIGAIVQSSTSGLLLMVGYEEDWTTDLTIERITFTVTEGESALISVFHTKRCAVRECHFNSGPSSETGIRLDFVDQIEIRDNQFSDVIVGVQSIYSSNLVVAGNGFAGPTSQASEGGPLVSGGYAAIDIRVLPLAGILSIQGNEIVDFSQGVFVQVSQGSIRGMTLPLQLSIEGNLVARQGLVPEWASNFGWSWNEPNTLSKLVESKAFGIFTDAPNARVVGNTVNLADPNHGGILIAGSGSTVLGNVITSSVTPQPPYSWPNLPVGIVAYKPVLTDAVDRCRIVDNNLNGPMKGIAVLAESDDLVLFPAVVDNRVNTSGLDLSKEPVDLTQPEEALDALWNELTNLDHAFGILLINVDRGDVARNVLSACTVGIAALFIVQVRFLVLQRLGVVGTTFDGNKVEESTIGVLVGSEAPVIQNTFLVLNQADIVLYSTEYAQVLNNECLGDSAGVHCLDLDGRFTRFEGNLVQGGATGMLAYSSDEVRFIRNTVQAMHGTGIIVSGCDGEICLEENRVSECGASGQSLIEENVVGVVPGLELEKGWQLDSPISAGIAVLNCSGVITIDGCAVTDTFQVAGSWCFDIVVVGAAHVRVRNCRVVRTTDVAQKSRGLLLLPARDEDDAERASTDASGNHIDLTHDPKQKNDFVAAEVNCGTNESDILFVGNMVTQRGGGTGRRWIVRLTAESLAITGNRILWLPRSDAHSLTITYKAGLSYVGNVVTGGATITALGGTGRDRPTPDTTFNAYPT